MSGWKGKTLLDMKDVLCKCSLLITMLTQHNKVFTNGQNSTLLFVQLWTGHESKYVLVDFIEYCAVSVGWELAQFCGDELLEVASCRQAHLVRSTLQS